VLIQRINLIRIIIIIIIIKIIIYCHIQWKNKKIRLQNIVKLITKTHINKFNIRICEIIVYFNNNSIFFFKTFLTKIVSSSFKTFLVQNYFQLLPISVNF